MKNKSKKPVKKTSVDLSQQVMAKIQEDDIQVKPKWQFLLGTFLMTFGVLSVSFLTAYFLSVSWYLLRMHSSLEYLWFGDKGQHAFWATFPWLFLILALVSLYMGIRIIKQFDMSYKVKWQYWMSGLILGVVVTAVWVNESGVHDMLERHTMAEPVYVEYHMDQNWYKGKVDRMEAQGMVITTMESGYQVQVRWKDSTRFPFGKDFGTGNWVIMVGDWRGDVFEAEGIEKVKPPF